ncbi:hypothetical protein [Paracoccus sp. (in: a-proteobacteria)]|jgi:hypothetical protein|uniref:hypothetical protein n=1 Tax=Paracoccus sp. TaxID=267 RepID=UPI0035B4DF5A
MARLVAYALAVALGWLALLAGGMFIPGAAPAALVVLPGRDFLARLPDPARLADASGRFSVTVAEASASQLYAAGALLVLPAGLPLCVDPRDKRR